MLLLLGYAALLASGLLGPEPTQMTFAWRNPLSLPYESQGAVHTELRDPCIIRDGNGYHAVFTMWPFRGRDEQHLGETDNGSSPGIAMYTSPNLTTWTFETWLLKSSELPANCPYKHRFWAPEVHKIGGKFYLIFTADNWLKPEYNPAGNWGNAGYAFVGVADRVTGPYEHITYIPHAPCDTSLCADLGGTIYAVMPKHDIHVQKLDLSRLAEGKAELVGPEVLAVTAKNDDIHFKADPEYLEGPWMERMGGKYVLLHAANYLDKAAPGYWTGVAYADSPLGPFRKDPRGQVFWGGHVSVFDGPGGFKWLAYRVEHDPKTRGRLAIDLTGWTADGNLSRSRPSQGGQVWTQAASSLGTEFDLQGYLDQALARGEKTITIPPGRYRVTPRNREHLALRGLKDVTILAGGVEMVCTETTRALSVSNCTNVTLRGLEIDYDPLPFTQGRITAISPDQRMHEIELFEGYPPAEQATNFKYEIFSADARLLHTGDYYPQKVVAVDARHLRVILPNGNDPASVGDIIAIGAEYAPHGSIPHAVECSGNVNVRLEDIDLWASNCFGFIEVNCDGSRYVRCRIDRRPPEQDPVKRADPRIRSLDADAFHSKHAVKGPQYLGCTAKFMGDDAINICGDYHMVTECAGRVLRVLAKGSMNIAVGDPVELFAYDGRRLPDAVAQTVERDGKMTDAEKTFVGKQRMDEGLRTRANVDAFKVTLDRAVELPTGSLIASARRMGNGFRVEGCDFGFNRSRGILIKASDGQVIGNKLTATWGPAILVSPEYWWLESGSSNNVEIRDNIIAECRTRAILVEAYGGAGLISGQPAPAGAHNHISVVGNRIIGCPLPNIFLTSVDGLRVERNTFEAPLAKPGQDVAAEVVRTVNCTAVSMAGNATR